MAEYVLPPEMDAFAEAAGNAAMGPFQAADFNADPSAAFSDGMGAAMDFMSDAGMPSTSSERLSILFSALSVSFSNFNASLLSLNASARSINS